MHRLSNDEIADALERLADLLEAHHANAFRVRAYRNAASFARRHGEALADVHARDGRDGLDALPTIGKGLARSIEELLRTGRLRQLERLRGEVTAEELFDSLPGVGDELAERIHETLHVETLEELEVAAHDGRLETVEGIGPGRAEMIRTGLAKRLRDESRERSRSRRDADGAGAPDAAPPVDLVLDVDAEYRRRAAAGELRKIAPRRFNPEGEAWLPILHADRDAWDFTALFSNTARAHELKKTDDWVVVFYEREGDDLEGQCTVVTETRGPDAGKRVVRGREKEGARSTDAT